MTNFGGFNGNVFQQGFNYTVRKINNSGVKGFLPSSNSGGALFNFNINIDVNPFDTMFSMPEFESPGYYPSGGGGIQQQLDNLRNSFLSAYHAIMYPPVQQNQQVPQVQQPQQPQEPEKPEVDRMKVINAAEILYDAMDGWGTDEDAIYRTLESLNGEEKAELEKVYAEIYGDGDLHALREDLRGDLDSDELGRAMSSLNQGVTKDPKLAAEALREAMEGGGTDEDTVHQIIDNASMEELQAIQKEFDKLEGEPGALKDWIEGDFSGMEEDAMVARLNKAALYTPGSECEEQEVDKEKCNRAAVILYDAMDGWGTDEESIYRALEDLNSAERAEVEKIYARKYGDGDLHALREDLRGDLDDDELDRAMRSLNSGLAGADAKVAAEALREAMEGGGTDERNVHQILDNATNEQLLEIQKEFRKLDSDSLVEWIKGDFSGEEEDSLVARLNRAALS